MSLSKQEVAVRVGDAVLTGIMWLADLGHKYTGPVPAIDKRLYLVDELACYQFHGPPPEGWQYSYVHHLDGDYQHRSPGNLAWASYSLEKREAFLRTVMRPDFLRANTFVLPVGRMMFDPAVKPVLQPLPVFPGSASVPPHYWSSMTPQFSPERVMRYAGVDATYKPTVMFVNDVEVLIDGRPKKGQPVIGLQINPKAGASFIIPLAYESAKEVADTIAKTLMLAAPELYFRPEVVKRLKTGKLSLEQLKDAI